MKWQQCQEQCGFDDDNRMRRNTEKDHIGPFGHQWWYIQHAGQKMMDPHQHQQTSHQHQLGKLLQFQVCQTLR